MNKQQLAAKIWESANQMRSKIEANEYKDYILGFIFYKYLSDQEVKFAKKEGMSEQEIKALSEKDKETVKYFSENLGYFISYKDLFSTWINKGKDFDVSNVRDALSAFSRLIHPNFNKLFQGIFNTLETGLSKLGDTATSQTKAISQLIQLIKDIPMDGKQDYDVLGFIYEYLIGMFAANAGKKAGEFYTPHEVSLLMSEIIADHLKSKKEIQIYDPTSGSGSLLINIGKSIAKHIENENNIKYYAQELKQNTYNLTRMNLVMRGILANNIITLNADTLEYDWPFYDEKDRENTYNPLYVNAVVSNPPYSQKWDSEHKENDARFSRFGLAPKTKADYAFLLHDLYHLKPDGIMTIVLPHGVLFRGGEEGNIRKALVEYNHIDAIIGLPPNIFFGTGIPTIIMVLRQERKNTDVLFVDASKGFVKEGKNNKLRASDIKRITDTVIARLSVPGFSRVVSKKEIQENEFNLNIPRYVDSSEKTESWDIYASMFGGIPKNELDELNEYWEAFPNLRSALFSNHESPYSSLKAKELKKSIQENEDVIGFKESFKNAFKNFDQYLKNELLTNMESIKVKQEETILSEEIFKRLKSIPLIDKYEAYQLLDDDWRIISVDLEMIQTEGFETIKKVDPKMVLKKKNGIESEVQEGWVGRVIPFELVEKYLLEKESENILMKEYRLLEIKSEYEEILELMNEEEKEAEFINEEKDGFINSIVGKEAKQFKAEAKKDSAYPEDSYEAKIIKVDELISEEKSLKQEIKSLTDILQIKIKETIENLGEEQIFNLLELKWISPLITSLYNLPEIVINNLTAKIETLVEKYKITYEEVVGEIKETESSLVSLLDELTGSKYDKEGIQEFQSLLKGGK
ncbi:type I restriction-modification system subunit M [Leptospira levettii]|uniref:type I restriction-modification system subunit M n=1 Tax=Leptospira levettii TaxID=2023178 RepID=UPI0010839BE4|nr:type I restriction-modification system subunit M [Leptospira levettii]TGM66442.1 type I restriction-modification system subunit M [Leptospira levettii]